MSNILGQSISVQLYIAPVNPRPIQTFLSFVSTLIMIIPVYKPNKFCVSWALFICFERPPRIDPYRTSSIWMHQSSPCCYWRAGSRNESDEMIILYCMLHALRLSLCNDSLTSSVHRTANSEMGMPYSSFLPIMVLI